jgi:CubicO group peptidase (beta-lactamase class C family)
MARSMLVAFVILSLAAPVLAGEPATAPASLAADPGVADAVAAWEAWLEYQLAIERIPAASVGIVHDQELLAARGFGFANPDTASPATADTIYSNWMTKVR